MRTAMPVIVAILVFACTVSAMRDSAVRRLAEFPGESLKWIHIAEPEFERRHLDVSKYNIIVFESPESVDVILRSLDQRPGTFGSIGKYPGYGVQISKKDGTILSSAYSR